MAKSVWRGWAVLIAVLIVIAAVGVALLVVAWNKAPARRHDDFWLDVGGAGLQVAVVSVLGAILTVTIGSLDSRRERVQRSLDRERETRRLLDELRLRIFHDLVAGYNQVKAIRRNLRSLGVRQPPDELNDGHIDGLRAQMLLLVEAQLSFEALWREINTNSGAFTDPDMMLSQIKGVEKYLHFLVKEWEDAGGAVWAGADGQRIRDLTKLQAFIGEKSAFKEGLSVPLFEMQGVVRQELARRKLVGLEPEDETDD